MLVSLGMQMPGGARGQDVGLNRMMTGSFPPSCNRKIGKDWSFARLWCDLFLPHHDVVNLRGQFPKGEGSKLSVLRFAPRVQNTKVKRFHNMLVVLEVLVVHDVVWQDTAATTWWIAFKRTVEVSSDKKSVALRHPGHAFLQPHEQLVSFVVNAVRITDRILIPVQNINMYLPSREADVQQPAIVYRTVLNITCLGKSGGYHGQ